MTDDELNKHLHKLIGRCWHEWSKEYGSSWSTSQCKRCKVKRLNNPQIDLVNTWEGFGILWEFVHKHEKFNKFLWDSGAHDYEEWCIRIKFVNPPVFAKAVWIFLEERNDYNWLAGMLEM